MLIARDPSLADSTFRVANYFIKKSAGSFSPLKLQKTLYLVQLVALGKLGRPIIEEDFQAWEFGPVIPALYLKLKNFGSNPVSSLIKISEEENFNVDEKAILDGIYAVVKNMSPGSLVGLTHQTNGAWDKNYAPGVKGKIIPKDDIKNEYGLIFK